MKDELLEILLDLSAIKKAIRLDSAWHQTDPSLVEKLENVMEKLDLFYLNNKGDSK